MGQIDFETKGENVEQIPHRLIQDLIQAQIMAETFAPKMFPKISLAVVSGWENIH